MIEYIRDPVQHAAEFASYNGIYRQSESHFQIGKFADRLLMRLAQDSEGKNRMSVLECGCGQGEYITRLSQYLGQAGVSEVETRGVDGSQVAIRQCETRYPQGRWVCDSVADFAANHSARYPGERYDLILEKTGIFFLGAEESARATVSDLWSLLSPGGTYAYFSSKSFYDGRMPEMNLSFDWLSLLEQKFGQSEDLFGDKAYGRLFRKTSADSAGAP
ncbi:MAG TPA: class I SAM-dependent methyltransferase [Rhodocyclaceae bacterium]|nr:class I SAM-dependent methyltransferase [Rhodocyclaceae bacterium]